MANLDIQRILEGTSAPAPAASEVSVDAMGQLVDAPDFQPPAEPKETAEEQAQRIRLLLSAGEDREGNPIITQFITPQIGEGFGVIGSRGERATRRDLIPPEVEALLSEEEIQQLGEIYGIGEFTTPPPEAGVLERFRTGILGRDPTEDEKQAIDIARERGSAIGHLERYINELRGKDPTYADITGAAPPELGEPSPAVQALLKKYKYKPITDRVSQDVELSVFGRVPVKDPTEFNKDVARANEALRLMAELPAGFNEAGEKVSVAESVVGQFLVEDINARYGTPDKQYTLEDLDLQLQPTAQGKRLTFEHPDPDVGRQPIDPVTFEWGDVLDQMPGLMIIGADIAGAITGGVTGAVSTGGGALAAGVAKWFTQKRALEIGGFTYDGETNSYVGKDAAGKKVSIPQMDIIMGGVSEAAWSAGGAALGSALFRAARAAFTRGTSEVEKFMNEDDFLEAYARYGKDKWGKDFEAAGIVESPAMVMERLARELRLEAKNLTGAEAAALNKQAARIETSTAGLRKLEDASLIDAGGARQQALGLIDETVRKGIDPAYFDDPKKFGLMVQQALQEGDGLQISRLITQMNKANTQLVDNWHSIWKGVDEAADPRTFGEDLALSVRVALGTADATGKPLSAGTTEVGVYGVLNTLRKKAKIGNRKAWDLTRIADGVESSIGGLRGAGGGAYPKEIQNFFHNIRLGAKGDRIKVSITELGRLNDLIDKAIPDAPINQKRRLFQLSEDVRRAEGRGYRNLDPKDGRQWKQAQKHLKEIKNGIAFQLTAQTERRNLDQVADSLFTNLRDDRIISEVVGDLSRQGIWGQDQVKLLKNILRSKYRRMVERRMTEEGATDAVVAGVPRTVEIGGTRFGKQVLDPAGHDEYLNKYGAWHRQLFPDDPEFRKFAATERIGRSEALKARWKNIETLENELRQLPWLKNQKIPDLAQAVLDDPHKIFDLAWQGNVATRTRAMKDLKRVLKKGLLKADYEIAENRLRALALRRVYNSDDAFAATKTGGYNTATVTRRNLDILEEERGAFEEVFGKAHYDDMREAFRQMDALANPPGRTAGEQFGEAALKEEGTGLRLFGLGLKVWVGVLNRKARALNLAQKWAGYGTELRFLRLMSDARALNKALKTKRDLKGRLAANALGSALFIDDEDAQDLIDEYTTTDSNGNIIPVPIQSPEEARTESYERELRKIEATPEGYSEGGLHQTPNPLPNEVPMPPQQRRRDLNFKALEGGGLTKAEEIEKLELDKSRIIDSIQQEIEATRKRMAEGIGYGRVGKEIGELMGIEAQAPSNWATHPDVQALMEKIQLTASAFDAKIDQIAAAP